MSDRNSLGGVTVQRRVAFGLNVDPHASGLATATRIATIADESGLEYVTC